MQKWEYCYIDRYMAHVRNFTPGGPSDAQIRADGAMGDQTVDDAIARLVANLGLNGWEMVGYDVKGIYFKRPLA
jgi:hypothetical protein